MEDHRIIELYRMRSEQAIAETAAKYGRYCHYIAKQILASDSDAEEIVNDTYLKTWNSIPPANPDPLRSYLGLITRHLAFDAYNARKTKKRGGNETALVLDELAECIPDNAGSTDIGENLALRDALNRFVRSLPERTATVFVRRYWYAASVSEIAAAYGMKESSVTVLMLRTRKKLKKYLEKEGFTL